MYTSDVVGADGLVKKLEEMDKTAGTYRNLMEYTRRLLRAFFDLSQAHRGTALSQAHDQVAYQFADCAAEAGIFC